jgi:hypothetical protein
MSDGENAVATIGDGLEFAEFLETSPPSRKRQIKNLFTRASGNSLLISTPQILIHCPSEMCNGLRVHRRIGQDIHLFPGDKGIKNFFVTYICSNCRDSLKFFSLQVEQSETNETNGSVYKFGEEPPFGPITPPRLLKLLGNQREMFLNGRRCEILGLGIGAFGYYRRVVENQRDRIINEIEKVSRKIGAADDIIATLEAAQKETQFSKSVSLVKNAIPPALLVNGHNPLLLLHNALSAGLHAETDETCLELAQAVRIVLVDLAERLSQAIRDEAELNNAVSRLLKAK